MLGMPPLSQCLGPILHIEDCKQARRVEREKELMTKLIDQLPPFARFYQHFHYSIENWSPWYWRGFSQTTQYTYVIEDLSCIDKVYSELSSHTRKNIRKSCKLVTLESPDDASEFFELNRQTFARQGLKLPYSTAFLERLDAACEDRQRRKIFMARGRDGQAHAGVYIVWDANSAYYIMGGSNPELRASEASTLCMWEAIKFAATVTRRFDFEGSMIERVEKFFRGFGGRPLPYHVVRRVDSKLLRAARGLRSCAGMR